MDAPANANNTDARTTNQRGIPLLPLESSAFWVNVAVVTFTVLAAIAGAFALYFSSQLNAAKDAQLDKFKSESAAKIAVADASAAEANNKAAEAGEGTAKALASAASANERASRLEVDAEQQRERAAQAERDAAEAKKTAANAGAGTAQALVQVAAANERAGRLELEAATQRERAAKAEKDLLELQEKIRPRRITADQRVRLVAALQQVPNKGPVTVSCILGDGEGIALANQIVEVLRAAGWTVDGVNQGVYTPNNPVGAFIRVRSAATAPPYGGPLQRAFQVAGITLDGNEVPTLAAGTLEILIGNKP